MLMFWVLLGGNLENHRAVVHQPRSPCGVWKSMVIHMQLDWWWNPIGGPQGLTSGWCQHGCFTPSQRRQKEWQGSQATWSWIHPHFFHRADVTSHCLQQRSACLDMLQFSTSTLSRIAMPCAVAALDCFGSPHGLRTRIIILTLMCHVRALLYMSYLSLKAFLTIKSCLKI